MASSSPPASAARPPSKARTPAPGGGSWRRPGCPARGAARAGPRSLAAWSATSGTSTLTITGSVDRLPATKPQVSVAQIHGSSDLPLIVMATGSPDAPCSHDTLTRAIPPGHVQLMTKENDDTSRGVLDPDYTLGSRYTLAVQAQ